MRRFIVKRAQAGQLLSKGAKFLSKAVKAAPKKAVKVVPKKPSSSMPPPPPPKKGPIMSGSNEAPRRNPTSDWEREYRRSINRPIDKDGLKADRRKAQIRYDYYGSWSDEYKKGGKIKKIKKAKSGKSFPDLNKVRNGRSLKKAMGGYKAMKTGGKTKKKK